MVLNRRWGIFFHGGDGVTKTSYSTEQSALMTSFSPDSASSSLFISFPSFGGWDCQSRLIGGPLTGLGE